MKVHCQIAVHFKISEHKFEDTLLILPSINSVVLANPFFRKYSIEISPGENILKLPEMTYELNEIQDGRLAQAYFSPIYKFFDQLLQKVENKATVLILVFKEFLQPSLRPLIFVLYAKGYHDFPLKGFVPQCRKISLGNPSLFQKNSGNE